MSTATEAYAALVDRGCLCGTDDIARCPLHKPGDNRGIRALFEAQMPLQFPSVATCTLCNREGLADDALLYPSIPLDRGEVPAGDGGPSTLICPRCSHPSLERALVLDAEDGGYVLNDRRVFA